MDPGSYGQGARYHPGVQMYFNQPSMPPPPVYQSYHQHGSQAPVYFAAHSLPVRADSQYQQPPVQIRGPPPSQHTAAQSSAFPFYSQIQNIPATAQGQPLSFPAPPPQQFTVPAPQSNLYRKTPTPPPAVPHPFTPPHPPALSVVEKTEAPQPLVPWSTVTSPPSSTGYILTNRSTTPPPLTFIPPRLKLLSEQYEQYKSSETYSNATSNRTPMNFLQAASQHGITVENPKQSVSATSTSVTSSCSSPTPFSQLDSGGFEKIMTGDEGGIKDRQDLVDYYVNKHENLGYQKPMEKDVAEQNECFDDKNVASEISFKDDNMNNNAKPFVIGNVLNWLSKSDDLVVQDCMKEEDKNVQDGTEVNGTQFDCYRNVQDGIEVNQSQFHYDEKIEDAFCRNEDVKNLYNNYETSSEKVEDSENFTDNYFDHSVDIVIEDHEFLLNGGQTSEFSDEGSSSSYDEADAYDEVDGEINPGNCHLAKKKSVLECTENNTAKQTVADKKLNKQLVETNSAADKAEHKQELAFSIPQTYDENIVNKYKQELKEAENVQIDLTTTNGLVEQIAAKIVNHAVAKGVLKFFSALKDSCANSEEEVSVDTSVYKEMNNNYGTESKQTVSENAKGLYTWSSASATSRGETGQILQEKEQTEEIRTIKNEGDANKIEIQPTSVEHEEVEDFEKFFFKVTASRYGITIGSPSKSVSDQTTSNRRDSEIENHDNLETSESLNNDDLNKHLYEFQGNTSYQCEPQVLHQLSKTQKEANRFGIRRFTEEFDSDITSVEGSQSDSGEVFKLKASRRGILVQDPKDRVELLTDSDAEVEQLSSHCSSRRQSAEIERRRSTSTPDHCRLSQNPETQEFKPGIKKRTVSGGLRPDAAEFNPGSLNSSLSLNTSVSESDASEKLDSSMRVDAPEFVPVSSKSSLKLKPDAAAIDPKDKQTIKQNKVFKIPKHKDRTSNPSVATQACPDTSTVCVGTKRIKTKESFTATGSCDSRDVSVNTVDTEIEAKNVSMKQRVEKLYTSKGSNTDITQKRSVSLKNEKPITHSVMTMTDPVPWKAEKDANSDLTDPDLMERLKKQDILLESMGKLQIELMLFKEKEIKEKLYGMKENFTKRMTGVIGLFTDSVETDMLQGMIQGKLSMLEEALAQVESITSTTISQIRSGEVLDKLPDFGSILPQFNKSPMQHFTSPQRQSVNHMLGTSIELSTSALEPVGLGSELETSTVKCQESNPELDASLQNSPSKNSCVHSETELKTSQEATVSLSTTDMEFKYPDINIESLNVSFPTEFGSQVNDHVSKLKSPNKAKSEQRMPLKTKDILSVEKSSTKMVSKKSPTSKVKDKVENRATTIAESVRELDDLKTEKTDLRSCQYGSKRKTRTKGFMELEGSSGDEDGEDSSALVIDTLDDVYEETKACITIEQETAITAVEKQEMKVTTTTETLKEELKPEITHRLENLKEVVKETVVDNVDSTDVKIVSPGDSEVQQIDLADEHEKDNQIATDRSNGEGSPKLGESGDMNKDSSAYNIADEDEKEASGNDVVFSKIGATDKLISKIMTAEYGGESEKSTSDMNEIHEQVVEDDMNKNNNNNMVDNSLDAIDSDENEIVKTNECVNRKTVKSKERKGDNNLEQKCENNEGDTEVSDVKRTTGKLQETINDDDEIAMTRTTTAAVSAVQSGIFDPQFNIDPKEVFMSPPGKGMLAVPSQHKSATEVAAKSAIVERPASQTSLVCASFGEMGNMPAMLGNMDPILYQAVLAQLIQAYPELTSNQEMLTQVAIQQTGLLQMYMGSQAGSGHDLGGLGVESSELLGTLGNSCMGMMGFGQQVLGPDRGRDSNKPVSLESSANLNVQGNATTVNNSSAEAPEFLINPLKSDCQDKAAKQLKTDNKSGVPPGLSLLGDMNIHGTEDGVESSTRKGMTSDSSYSSVGVSDDLVSKKETVNGSKVRVQSASLSENTVKSSQSSAGLDDFDLTPSYGTRPKSFGRNNNAFSEEEKSNNSDTRANLPPDFLPDFVNRHKQENTSTRVVHHFIKNVSDTVARAIASSDQVHFERRSQSPIPAAEPVRCKEGQSNFPPLQKSCWQELGQTGTVSKVKNAQKPAAGVSSGKIQTSTKTQNPQYTGPANLPPRLRRQSSADSQPHVAMLNQEPKQYQVPKKDTWDSEVDDYAHTFTLHHDVNKPITMATDKNQEADLTNPFLVPVSKDVPKVKSSSSVTDLCDIPLPKVAEKREAEPEVVDEWQEVQNKRKRHSSKEQKKEQKKELRHVSAPYLNSAPVTGAKQQKKNNFERLVGRMQQEFPHANKQEVIEAIQKIRVERGTLSGLSMEAIVEKANQFIKPAKKKIPGLWADQKQPVQTLNISARVPPAAKSSETCTNTFDEDICVICHDALSTDPVKELDCMHVFHAQCISQWVERERTCPTCRKHALFPEEFPRLGK